MRTVFLGLIFLSMFGLGLGFAGRFHGIGDSFAVLRPVFVVLLVVLSGIAVLGQPRVLGMLGICLAGVGALSITTPSPAVLVPDDAKHYSAYQKNLLFRLADTRPVAQDILQSEADFVMLQEVHRGNRSVLATLGDAFPFQHFCPFTSVGGTAVLSRWPIVTKADCDTNGGVTAIQVETPDGLLWVLSLHLHWAFPFGQAGQVSEIVPILEGFEGPILIGGDFNMVPWSHSVASLARASETKLFDFAGGTFAFTYHQDGQNFASPLPRLPIDHVLIPKNGALIKLERRPRLGSDHHGVLAEFVLNVAAAQ